MNSVTNFSSWLLINVKLHFPMANIVPPPKTSNTVFVSVKDVSSLTIFLKSLNDITLICAPVSHLQHNFLLLIFIYSDQSLFFISISYTSHKPESLLTF